MNNERSYTKTELASAKRARKYQSILGWPSISTFLRAIDAGNIKNCDVTREDVLRAQKIYGTPTAILQGKMKRLSPTSHPKTTTLPVPSYILENFKNLIMAIDIFFVNGILFFISKTEKLNFISASRLKGWNISQIVKLIKRDCDKYKRTGFDIMDIHADNEFSSEKIEAQLCPITMHIYAANEHMGFI